MNTNLTTNHLVSVSYEVEIFSGGRLPAVVLGELSVRVCMSGSEVPCPWWVKFAVKDGRPLRAEKSASSKLAAKRCS